MKKILVIGIAVIYLSLTASFAQNNVPKRVTGGVCNSLTTYFPQPDYPKIDVKGAVNVFVKIDEEGNVESATAVSGHPLARLNAEKAAQKAKFRVTTHSGKPVKISCVLVYQFNPTELIIQKEDEAKIQEKEISKGKLIKDQTSAVINGRAIKLVKPPFPSCDCKFTKKNIVIIQAKIDEQGNVIKAVAISGHPILKQASIQAARHSRFSSTIVLGVRVKAKALIKYEFDLMNNTSVKINVESIKAEVE